MANRGIYPALSGAMAEGRALEAVSANLANASTASFRGQRLTFREALGQARGRGDLRYVRTAEPVLDTSPGPMRFTGQATDVGLSGPGFLVVGAPGGPRYVRGGALVRAADGRLLTGAGHAVLGADDQPLRLPPGELVIGRRGEVLV